MWGKNLIPSSVPSFVACDEPFPSVSHRCLPQPCVDPRAATRIMGPGGTRGWCKCLGWWETNQHAGGLDFLALGAPGSPRFELGECSRCSSPAGLRWGISFISCAKDCPPAKASTVETPVVFLGVNFSIRVRTRGPFGVFLGMAWSLSQQAGPSGQGEWITQPRIHASVWENTVCCRLAPEPEGKGKSAEWKAVERLGGASALAAAQSPPPKCHR